MKPKTKNDAETKKSTSENSDAVTPEADGFTNASGNSAIPRKWSIPAAIAWFIVAGYLACVSYNAIDIYRMSVNDDRTYDYEYVPASGGPPITINFKTKGDVEEFKRLQYLTEGPWTALVLIWMPRNYAPFLGPVFFGLFGGACGLLFMVARGADVTWAKLLLEPLVGLLIGLLFYAISMLVPKLLVAQETSPSWLTLIWLSFVGGFFTEHAYAFLKRMATKIFGPSPRK